MHSYPSSRVPVSITTATAHLMERYKCMQSTCRIEPVVTEINTFQYMCVHERWLPVIPFWCHAFRICTYFVCLSLHSRVARWCVAVWSIRLEDIRDREWVRMGRQYLIKSNATSFLNGIILTHWVTDANIRISSNESSFQHESFCISASFTFAILKLIIQRKYL